MVVVVVVARVVARAVVRVVAMAESRLGRGGRGGRAKSSMPQMPSLPLSLLSSAALLEGDLSRKDNGKGRGGRRGGAPTPMAPSGTPGAPCRGHTGISSTAPHAPRCGYGGDCGSSGGVRSCSSTVVKGGDFGRGRMMAPPPQPMWGTK